MQKSRKWSVKKAAINGAIIIYAWALIRVFTWGGVSIRSEGAAALAGELLPKYAFSGAVLFGVIALVRNAVVDARE